MILGSLLLLATFTGIESVPFAIAASLAVGYKVVQRLRRFTFYVA